MPKEKKPDPLHVKWLVEHRTANQLVSARLYELLRNYPSLTRNRHFGIKAQMLIAISFSLWRSAFLSDKTGEFKDTREGAELFLEEMLMNNAINYSQDRQSKDWTFNYYTVNARYRILEYCKDHPEIKIGPLNSTKHKERWKQMHHAFEMLVSHFEKSLEKAKKSETKWFE